MREIIYHRFYFNGLGHKTNISSLDIGLGFLGSAKKKFVKNGEALNNGEELGGLGSLWFLNHFNGNRAKKRMRLRSGKTVQFLAGCCWLRHILMMNKY